MAASGRASSAAWTVFDPAGRALNRLYPVQLRQPVRDPRSIPATVAWIRTKAFAPAEAKLTKALSTVPDHARAHMFLGFVEMMTKRAAEGIAECEHASARAA